MAHVGQEIALCQVRGFGGLLAPRQLLLRKRPRRAIADDGQEADGSTIDVAIDRHRLFERLLDAVHDHLVLERLGRNSCLVHLRVHVAQLRDPLLRRRILPEARPGQGFPRAAEQPAEGVVDEPITSREVDHRAGVFDLVENRPIAQVIEILGPGRFVIAPNRPCDRDDALLVAAFLNRGRDIGDEFVSVAVDGRDAAGVDASVGDEKSLKTLVVAPAVPHRDDDVRMASDGLGPNPAE